MTRELPDPSPDAAWGTDGVAHLRVLARAPRAAGSAEERQARDYCARVLGDLGFEVSREPFSYSGFPGRYGTPIGGAIAAASVLVTFWLATIEGVPLAAAIVFGAGLLLLVLFVWIMVGDAVLDLPWLRADGENLVARRGHAAPRVWLVAHVDSKSQPVPTRVRIAGIAVLGASVVLTALTLAAGSSRTILWMLCAALAAVGGRAVVASVVRNDSPGAVDNASGVAAVLAAASSLDPAAPVAVLITSAEELGLAGARAWVRAHVAERAFVMNCDGVDDIGELTLMYTRTNPAPIVSAVERVAGAVRVLRMPPGLLLDSVAFADVKWSAATLSHGSMQTLARVHTRRDTLDALTGTQIDPMAFVLARAAETLAR
ncbi:MAG TPA: M28 family peptidase [Gemmatimonadaceae bacterium]|nr:M28 family peptidase [Gemmatimonadaceae bacterium]